MDGAETNKRPDNTQGLALCPTKGDLSQFCRVCANFNDCLIPIFEGEGLEHELGSKIQKHLPIKVSSSDNLPVHLCYQCASTLLAWNDLVVCCVEADKKLHQLFLEIEKEKNDLPTVEYHESAAVNFGVDGCSDSYNNNRVEDVPGTSPQGETTNVPLVQPVKKRTIRTRLSHKIKASRKEEVKTVEEGKQEITSEERCPSSVTPFKAYHQSQIALRSQLTEVQLNIKSGYVDDEPVFCPYCGKMFMTHNEITSHVSEHMQQLPFNCSDCNITFNQHIELEDHLLFHNKDDTCVKKKKNHFTEEFVCNFCGVRFNKKLDEIKHKRVYHSLKDIKPDASGKFPCNVCGKSFARAFHMQFHKEKHHININEPDVSISVEVDDKKLINYCQTCNKSFTRKFDLKRHILKAHGTAENEILPDINVSGSQNIEGKDDEIENSGILMNGAISNEFKLCDRPTEQLKEVKNQEKINSIVNRQNQDVDNDEDTDNFSVNSEEISRHLDMPVTSTVQTLPEIKSYIRSHKCTLCNHVYTRKHDMLKHRRSAHTLEERKKDPFEETLNSKKNKQKNTRYECSECGNYYSRSSDLQKHLYTKHGGDSYIDRRVGTIDDMDVEILNKAKMEINGNIVYHCELCGKNILTKRGYVRHVRVHTGERPFTCHICGKQYRSSTDLTRHLRCVHDGVKNYQCDVCDRYFANKGTRNDHRRTHTGERPYICHTCGKAFPTPNSIYVHRRIHTDYFPHQCTSCDKRFRRRQQLIHHIRTHTGEKPHACDLCGKRFGVKDEVARHKLTHSNEKPHACSICGLCFGQKRYLKNHMKTHHLHLI